MIIYVGIIILLIVTSSKCTSFSDSYLSKENTDVIRGIFILLILASHFSKYVPAYTAPLDLAYWQIRVVLGQCVVSMFLFYSGYGIVDSVKRKGFHYTAALPRKRIIKTLLIWDFSQILFFSLGIFMGKTYSIQQIAYSLLSWESLGNDNWYICVIICLYLFSWVAFRMYREHCKAAVSVITVLSILLIVFLIYSNKGTWWYNTIFCYPAGAWYSLYKEKIEEIIKRGRSYWWIFIAVAISCFVTYELRETHIIWYELTAVFFALCVLFITMKVQISSRVLRYCGMHLSSLFLLHRLPMIFFQNTKVGENIYIYFAICVGFAFALSFLFDQVIVFISKKGTVMLQKLKKYQFLFEELVKRDFKKKYKRTVLGVIWSMLSPLLMLLVMRLVFTQFFGRGMEHYTTYLFCGNLIFSYFRESTDQGMTALVGNAGIFSKVNVPKYMFLFSKNVQTLINFGLTLCIFFLFCMLDHITFTWKFVLLLYPIACLLLFNIGVSMILSALFVFFKDVQYLWTVCTQLLMYLSAIFYTIDQYPLQVRYLFFLNPVYLFIRYFRKIVIDSVIPSPEFYLLMLFYTVAALGIGCWMYVKYNHKFLYYV